MRFDGFIGNTDLKARLSAAASAGKLSHCYLLCGPDGSGRHTLARILSAAMQCTSAGETPCGVCPACRKSLCNTHPDIIMVNDSEHKRIGVDVIREMIADVYIRPNEGKRKIYILEQDMTEESQNALLKILEEPPQYAAFLLLSTHPEKLLVTIRSRCVMLQLSPLSADDALGELARRCENASHEDLLAALQRSGGYLGPAIAAANETPSEHLAQFAQCYAAADHLAMLRLLLSMEKWKRTQLADMFSQWRALLVQALSGKNGVRVSSQASSICARRTGEQLLSVCQALQTAIDALDGNANTGAVIGWLTTKLCT